MTTHKFKVIAYETIKRTWTINLKASDEKEAEKFVYSDIAHYKKSGLEFVDHHDFRVASVSRIKDKQ